jgi:hypothetical protein
MFYPILFVEVLKFPKNKIKNNKEPNVVKENKKSFEMFIKKYFVVQHGIFKIN